MYYENAFINRKEYSLRTSVGCPRSPFSVGSNVMQAGGAEAAWARGYLLNIAARSATIT